MAKLNIVLHEPEIPANTGNIGRTCVATGTGCSPIREGVLLIRPDTTLADVCKFGEECQRRWGITPLQIFLHKDEGHWLNGQSKTEDKESFQVGSRWFKPNYHAHVVFDWMNHETGKSRKLNDEDMATMQTLASDILLMERGQAKAITGKEHLERNDFIIEKQKAELQRIEETKRHTKTVQHREVFKKQTGGRGKFADIIFEIGPADDGPMGLTFVDQDIATIGFFIKQL